VPSTTRYRPARREAIDGVDFQFLRDSAGLSDSALSKQLTTLEDAGYIEIRKGFVGKRPRTARLTSVGRTAFDQHVAALQEIVAKTGRVGAALDLRDARKGPCLSAGLAWQSGNDHRSS
jgi:DNA-binding MarR family transcriptional regulator